jgi:RNA-directed DNA polymerase
MNPVLSEIPGRAPRVGFGPAVWFERYADDAIVHCVTERQARHVLAALENRMEEAGLRLHPAKTRIVYCKDGKRRGDSEHTSFTFLGFTFQPRTARRKDGSLHLLFLPAISREALKKISGEVRSWRLHRRVTFTFAGLAAVINPIVAGWMQYYGRFRRSAMSALLARINAYLVRWIRKKYRRLQGTHKAHRKLREITQRNPRMFAHWKWVPSAWS